MKSNKTFNRGTIKFTFTDEDGEVFSSFRMNPTDIGLLKRAEEISKHFEDMKDRFSGVASADEMQRLNQDIEEKINFLLRYDASNEIFGEDTATRVSQDGEIFALMVMDTIAEKLKPEMEKRRLKMQQGIEKYTAKYGK